MMHPGCECVQPGGEANPSSGVVLLLRVRIIRIRTIEEAPPLNARERKDAAAPLPVISLLYRRMRQLEHHLGLRSQELGIRSADAQLLAYVAVHGPCRMVELRRVFGHRPSTMTSLLDRLESSGWIERAPDPEDRRGLVVAATEAGQELGRRARAEAEELEEAIRQRIRPRDLEGYQRVLRALGEITDFAERGVAKPQEPTYGSTSEST